MQSESEEMAARFTVVRFMSSVASLSVFIWLSGLLALKGVHGAFWHSSFQLELQLFSDLLRLAA